MRILACRIDPSECEASIDFLTPFVDDAARERMMRLRFPADRMRRLAAEVLVRVEASLLTGISPQAIAFELNPHGKPSLPDPRPFHFNTSHSGAWVVAAFHDSDIGVDVERVRTLSDLEAIASDFFSPLERQAVAGAAAEQRNDAFFDLWTLKESFIKAVGEGLNMPLDSFSIDRCEDGTARVSEGESNGPWFFRRYAPDPEHRVAVCCHSDAFPDALEIRDVPWLLERAREAERAVRH